MSELPEVRVPVWVPESALRYLAHTEAGISIRDIARRAGCHASTVMRQIRRIESRRDDILVDQALQGLAGDMRQPSPQPEDRTDKPTLDREAVRVMRRLCESGAVLAVAEDMDKAVVVRDGETGAGTRTAVVDVPIAQAMALNDWITCDRPGRISRYRITAAGRAALSHLIAEAESRAMAETGFAEAQTPFGGAPRGDTTAADRPARVRYNTAESPLILLSRRKDKSGQPFLSDDLVRAGERLREDFELAQMGPNVTQNWDSFLTGGARSGTADSGAGNGPERARARVAQALADLGPGLSDVAIRCCCYLEGLEIAEKRMGWSARSGKIVLRIALQRLKRHYDDPQAPRHQMVG